VSQLASIAPRPQAGIGVDYGMQELPGAGESVCNAYMHTLRINGASIIFAGITLTSP
jgi:hypothetical protein